MVVAGHDLYEEYGMVMEDGFVLSPPKVKEYLIDRVGGDGAIDLTGAFDDVFYEDREQEFVFGIINPSDFEAAKTRVSSFLHGQEHDYTLTFDPGYIYHGRFFVDEYYSKMHIGRIKVKVRAQPYKSAGVRVHEVDAQAGAYVELHPGRGSVSPVFESKMPIHVMANGVDVTLPAGSHKAVGLTVRAGKSNVYVNTGGSIRGGSASWGDLSGKTWGSVAGKRWHEIMWLDGKPAENDAYKVKIAYEVREL